MTKGKDKMEKTLTEQYYIIGGKHVHYSYNKATKKLVDITIQEDDDEVTFTGSPEQARALFEVLDSMAGEEII